VNARAASIAKRGRARTRRLPAFCGAAAFALSGGVVFAQSKYDFAKPDLAKPDFAAAAKGVVAALDLQTAFPNQAVASAVDSFRLDGSLARALLWVAVAVGAVVIALYLKDILPGGRMARRRRWDADGSDPQAAGPGGETQAQIDADELARLGRFVEAMHVLLLQALADMRRRLNVAIADSLTSREILRRASVSPTAKSALQEIVGAVERAYFGDHPADESDYSACRANFSAFVGALHGGGGA
jgi:hypothetical protein